MLPIIKWTGSKRFAGPKLSPYIPISDRYVEPFLGGGAMLAYAKSNVLIGSDIIPELIWLWRLIQEYPEGIATEYRKNWELLSVLGQEYYYNVRTRYNRLKNSHDLFFLTRTCINGLIRFNQHGEFNIPFHHNRPGIDPNSLKDIAYKWSFLLNGATLIRRDYREALSDAKLGDFYFLDPPYFKTKGIYQSGMFDYPELWMSLDKLHSQHIRWMLTFNGEEGLVPEDVYTNVLVLDTKSSPMRRVLQNNNIGTSERVYMNYTTDLSY